MTQTYNADAIEVLTGLEPVRRRPGMYTDTTRPNHLGQEVIDNSVDEALAGHAKRVDVILHADQSLEVIDDGRGMPVDIHPEEGVPAVELILCRLHAGGKFSNKNYQFSGGLHGVGISVVNALSKRVEVNVRRDGQVYNIAFENGEKVQDLQVVGTCGKRNTGTSVHFWPDETFFDSPRYADCVDRANYNPQVADDDAAAATYGVLAHRPGYVPATQAETRSAHRAARQTPGYPATGFAIAHQ